MNTATDPATAARTAAIATLRDLPDVLIYNEAEHLAETTRFLDPRYLGAHQLFAHTVRVVTLRTHLVVSGAGAHGAPLADGADPFTVVVYPPVDPGDVDAFAGALHEPLRTAVLEMLRQVADTRPTP